MSLIKIAKSFKNKVRSYFKDDNLTPSQKALIASGIASGTYAIPKSLKENLLDVIERQKTPMTMDEILRMIRPGDVIMSRIPRDYSSHVTLGDVFPKINPNLKGVNSPLKVNELIQLILGSPYTHASMKMQHGNDILNVMMNDQGAKIEDMAEALKGSEFKVYRPFGLRPEQYEEAIEGAGSLVGKPYRPMKYTILSGLKHLLSPIGTKTYTMNLCDGNQTCMSAIGNAYPHIFPTEESVVDTIRSTPHMEYMGRYNPGGITPSNYERMATKVISPILKSLKYALPVGAATYAYNKLQE